MKRSLVGLIILASIHPLSAFAAERTGPEIFDRMCSKCHYISGIAPFDAVDGSKIDLMGESRSGGSRLSDIERVKRQIQEGGKYGSMEMPAFKYKKSFIKKQFPILVEWLDGLQ